MILILSESRKKIIAWCLYDWACSSFSVIVTTFIFATYFTTKVAINEISGTYLWAAATAIAGVIIAILSPLFGAIADYGGKHKRWLFVFTSIAIISSALLWFAYPQPQSIYFTLACFILGTIGLEIATVFYNAFLPTLVSSDYIGRVSGWGWGSGYFGGIAALTVALIIFVKSNVFGLDATSAQQVRICGPFVAIWYALFSIPLFIFVPALKTPHRPLSEAIRMGVRDLIATLKKLTQERNILIYLIAHMIYADGLNTLFIFGGIYAAGTFGLSFEEVLLFGITMNITAGLGAVILGWMDDFLGSKETIILSLVCLILFGIPLLLLNDKYYFWATALVLCLFVGPVQSASRSLIVRLLMKKEMSAEMFGLYALSGRITSFLGPWILGMATYHFASQRVGMATVLVFFAFGALLLLPVKVKQV